MTWAKTKYIKPPKIGIREEDRPKLRLRLATMIYNRGKITYTMDEIMEMVNDPLFKEGLIPRGARWKKTDINRALYELQERGVISIGGEDIEVHPIIEKFLEKGGW